MADLKLSAGDARAELRRISTEDSATKERADYLEIFVGDTGDRETEAQVAKLADDFLKEYPDSRFEAEVRMKWGEILYRQGDCLVPGASSDPAVVEKFPDSPLAEKALFLSGQAMARSLDPSEMEEAIEVFEQVVKSGGPLSLRARLAEASLLNALKRPKEALGVLDRILESNPDPDLRYATLVEKGDTLFSQGAQDPGNYQSAIATWRQISETADAPTIWATKRWQKWAPLTKNSAIPTLPSLATMACFRRVRRGRGPEFFGFTGPASMPVDCWNPNACGKRRSLCTKRSAASMALAPRKLASALIDCAWGILFGIARGLVLSYADKSIKLFIPGPVEVSEKTLRAMCQPMVAIVARILNTSIVKSKRDLDLSSRRKGPFFFPPHRHGV